MHVLVTNVKPHITPQVTLSFRNPLLQELLLSGTHYQTPSPRWLRYHPSEAICLLHHARRRAHSIAEISVRRLAIIIQIQIQRSDVCQCHCFVADIHV